MKDLKHTPGPWSLGTENSNSIEIESALGEKTCEIIADNDLEETHYADAKLISAAPELLQALIDLEEANPTDGKWNYQAAMLKAREVIKKATE
jgi:hypothetical protein